MGGPLEHQRDLGDPAAQALTGPEVERHPRPAPGVDLEFDGGERLGGRGLGEAVLVEQADHLLAALPARGVLPARGGQIQRLGQPGRGEHLDLLGLDLIGGEAHRLLHGGQRQKLQQMVLDHVPGGADPVVVAGAAAEADVLGHGDLHAVDVVAVPDRLIERVGEAQRQDVLHRLLAEVVVDAEHRFLGEHAVDHFVEFDGALQVVAEWLLDHHPAPLVLFRGGQSGTFQLLAHHRERFRRNRQVEGMVAACPALGVKLFEGLGEQREGRVVVETSLHEPESLGQAIPDLLPERGPGVFLDGVVDDLAEVLIGPLAAGEAHQ